VDVAVVAKRKKKKRKKQNQQRNRRKRKTKMAEQKYCNRQMYRGVQRRAQRIPHNSDRDYVYRPENRLEHTMTSDPLGLDPLIISAVVTAQQTRGK
jgi:hypothetical protein